MHLKFPASLSFAQHSSSGQRFTTETKHPWRPASEFRSTVRTSLPTSTSWASASLRVFRPLFHVRSRGWVLFITAPPAPAAVGPCWAGRRLMNLCVLSWPTCPSPGGTAAPAARRSSQDTTHTASAPAGCSARPTRSCECATVGWCTCPVSSRARAQPHRRRRGTEYLTHASRVSSSFLLVGLAPLNSPLA